MLHIHATAYNELAPVNSVSGVIPDDGGSIGRGEGNTVALSDPSRMVSRRHLEFRPDGRGGFILVNVSTANPVLVNGRELGAGMSCPIGDGDCIQIGNFMVDVGRRAPAAAGPTSDPGDQAEIARLTGWSEPDPLGLGLAGSRAAEAGSIAGDFLSDLLGESAAAQPPAIRAAEPAVGYDELDIFAQTPRRGDPIEELGGSGLELRDLGPRGDALINADDSAAAVAELTRDPLLDRSGVEDADRRVVDPLALFDDPRSGGLDLAAAGIGTVAADSNHGSELDGLFRLPAVAGATYSAAIPPDNGMRLDSAGRDSWRQSLAGAGEGVGSSAPFDSVVPADGEGAGQGGGPTAAAPGGQSVASPRAPGGLLVPDFDWREALEPATDSSPADAALLPSEAANDLGGLAPLGGFPSPVSPPGHSTFPAPSESLGRPAGDEQLGGSTGREHDAPAGSELQTRNAFAPQRPDPEAVNRPTEGRTARAGTTPVMPGAEASEASSPDDLYRAFLEGLGVEALPERAGLDPDFMRLVGRILRACAQGTVELMVARAAVKREVKANVTLIAPERNNPLKFSPDGEVALMYLLGRPYPGFMKPVDAVNHAYADLRAHQLGMISGMRTALAHVLDRFNPDVIDREALRAGLVDSLLSIGRKARLWDAYGRYFETTRENAEDRFQEFFGSVFVNAYEQAATDSRAAFRARGEGRE